MATNFNNLDLSKYGLSYDNKSKTFESQEDKTKDTWDWRSKSGDELIKDARFIETLKEYYGTGSDYSNGRDAGVFFNDIDDDDDLINTFLMDRYISNYNTVGAGVDLVRSQTGNVQDKEALELMQHAYNNMGNFWNDKERGARRFGYLAGSLIVDPLNLFGFGAGAKIGANAYRTARMYGATKGAAKKAALTKGAIQGAKVEGLIGLGAGGTVGSMIQARDMSLGLQNNFSKKQLLYDTALGGLLGAGLGAGFGAGGAAWGARANAKIKDAGRYGVDFQTGDSLLPGLTNREFDTALDNVGTTLQIDDMRPGKKLGDEALNAQATLDDMKVNPNDYTQEQLSAAITRTATIKALLNLPQEIEKIKKTISETTDPDQTVQLEERLIELQSIHDDAMNATNADQVDAALERLNSNYKKTDVDEATPDQAPDEPDLDVEAEADAADVEMEGQKLLDDETAEEIYSDLVLNFREETGAISAADLPDYIRTKILDLDDELISADNKQKLLDIHDQITRKDMSEEEIFEESATVLPVQNVGGRPKKIPLHKLSEDERDLFFDKVNKYETNFKRANPQASNMFINKSVREYSEFIFEKIISEGKLNRTVKSNIGKFSGDTPENPLPKGAGRVLNTNPDQTKSLGKVQSFLRKGGSAGEFIGRTPIKSEKDLYKVQAIAESGNIKGPIRFKWTGKKKLKTADGEEIQSGGTAFYIDNPQEGRMGKVYKNIENVTNEKPIRQEDLDTKVDTRDQNAQLIRVLEKKIEAGKGTDADVKNLKRLKDETTTIDKAETDSPEASYQNMLKDTEEKTKAMLIEKITQKLGKPAKPKTETTPTKKTTIVDDDAIEIPDGQVIAILSKKNPNTIRVMTSKQKAEGKNVKDILGKANKADWEVGYVPEGMRNSDAIANFKPLSKDDIPDVRIESPDTFSSKGKDIGKKSHYNNDELSDIDIDFSDLKSPDGKTSLIEYFDKQSKGGLFRGKKDKRQTADIGWRMADIFEGMSFQYWAKNTDFLSDTLYKLYQRLPERKPNTQTREDSFKQVKHLIGNAGSKELNIVKRMFNALDIEAFPIFRNFQDNARATSAGVIDPTAVQGATITPSSQIAGAGDISVNPARTGDFDPELTTGQRSIEEDAAAMQLEYDNTFRNIPDRHAPSMMIAHEFAHWSYFNVLSPEDKAIFHKSLSKYISTTTDGGRKVDFVKLAKMTYDADDYMGINSMHSPQEFFANQFVLWVNGRKNIVGSDNYWANIYRKVKAMFNRLTNSDEAIDPDLVPIFNKLLPDEKQIVKSTAKATTPLSKSLQNQVWNLRMLRDEMYDTINGTQDPIAAHDYLSDIYRSLKEIEDQAELNPSAYTQEFVDLVSTLKNNVYEKVSLASSKYDYGNNIFSKEIPEDILDYANEISPYMDDIINGLSDSFGSANNTPDATPTIRENIFADKPKAKTKEEIVKKVVLAEKVKRKRISQEKTLNRKVENIVKSKVKPKQQELGDADLLNAKKISHSELKTKFTEAETGSAEQRIYGNELYARLVSRLPVPKVKVVSREVMSMRKDDMITELHKSLKNKDMKRYNEIYAEIYRRQIKKNPTKGVFTVTNQKLKTAVRDESDELIDVLDNDILPVGSNVQKKMLLAKSTHRNPQVQNQLRNFLNKIILLNGNTPDYTGAKPRHNKSGEKISRASLSSSDRDYDTYVSGMMFDTNAEDFKTLRKMGRGFAVEVTKDNPNVEKVLTSINEAIFSTNYLTSKHRQIITDIYKAQTDYKPSSSMDDITASEDWFINTMVKIQKGDIAYPEVIPNDDINSNLFHNIIEETNQAAAWFLNRATDKVDAPILRMYGDLLNSGNMRMRGEDFYVSPNVTTPVYLAKHVGRNAIKNIMGDRTRSFNLQNFLGIDNLSDGVQVYYHGTPQGSSFAKKNKPLIDVKHGDGMFGPGFYITDEPKVASAFAGSNMTRRAKQSLVDQYGAEGAQDIMYFHELKKEFDAMYSYSNNLKEMGIDKSQGTYEAYTDQIRILNEMADELSTKYNYIPEPTVLPVFARLKNGFDASEQMIPMQGNSVAENIEYKRIIDFAEEEGLIDPSGIQRYFDDPYENLSTEDFYVRMIKMLNDEIVDDTQPWFRQDITIGKARMTGILKRLGYDHIIHHQPQKDLATGEYVAGKAFAAFDNNQVKHVNSKVFDENSSAFYDDEMGAGTLAGDILLSGSNPDVLYSARKMDGLLHGLEKSGIDPDVIDTLRHIKEKKVTKKSVNTAKKASLLDRLRSNSNRMRLKMNANWIADWIAPLSGAGHYAKHNAMAGEKFVPLMNMLNNLPDSFRWYENYGSKFKVFGEVPQPPSHKRILRALRYGLDPDSAAYKRLSNQEMMVAQKINQMFKDEWNFLNDSGVQMGHIRNYVPRVYNPEAIKKNMNGFVEKIAAYLQREANIDGRRLSVSEGVEKAKAIAMRITDEDGTYIPPVAEKKSAHSDNIDFQRMLKLNGEELEGLEEFLVNDLSSVLAKYIDGSTRRGLFTQQFGYNNFGFDDYMRVATEGTAGIANMLGSKKVSKVTLRFPTDEGGMDAVTVQIPELFVPKAFEDPSYARMFANHIAELVSQGKKQQAKAKLMEFQGEGGKQWKHRVEAIINGLDDFGADANALTPDQVKFIMGSFRVIQRKPLDSSGTFYDKLSLTSKLLRNINAVTLLSYTTLTSIPDVFLPLLRGGKMGSFVKAWKKYSTDKDYREMMSRVGLNIENITHDRLAGMYGSAGGRTANNFFHISLLSPWTDTMRKIGGAVGFETLRTMNRIAAKTYRADGKMPVKYRTAARLLRQFGLEDYSKPDPKTGRFKTIGEMGEMMGSVDSMRFREAMIKFANESIFAPNPDDNPLWAQTPIGSMAYQLKAFPVMMGRLSANIIKEAYQGNVAPMIYFFTVATGLGGTTSLALKDIIQMRGGEDENRAALRERLLTNISKEFGNKDGKIKWVDNAEDDLAQFVKDHPEMASIAIAAGYNPGMHGSIDSFFGWYIESILQTGGLGMLGELLYNSAAQADNGQYGFQRMLSYVFGPSVDIGVTGWNTISAGQEFVSDAAGADVTNAKRRTAIRSLLNRIPFLGGNRSFREQGTNILAGEADDNKQVRWGNTSGFSGGFGSATF